VRRGRDSRERFVHDLNAAEDVTAAEVNVQAAKDDLANKVEALQINETF
jgi:hypothetical protein